jgi:hypothetical protein
MKLYIITLLCMGPMIASAERMIRFTFNSTQTCTAADTIKIASIFNPTVRRQLRVSNNADRELGQRCQSSCGSMVPPFCFGTGCSDSGRRNLQSADFNLTCHEEVSALDTKLNLLINNNEVSGSCKLFLAGANRKRECYNDVVYGVIESILVWNMTDSAKPTLITDNMHNGFTVCKSQAFAIEAKVNPCVDFVNFHMIGSSSSSSGYFLNRTENKIPYTLFASSAQSNMVGMKMDNWGFYNLTVTPDGFETKKKSIYFSVLGRC